MKTILTKKIDGYDIITGFGTPVIDPFATREIVWPKLFESAETKAIISKKTEIDELNKMLKDDEKSEHLALMNGVLLNGNKLEIEKAKDDHKRHKIMIEERIKELIPLNNAYEEKRKALMIEHAVYFQPKAGEEIITDEKAAELSKKIMALGENEKLSAGGKTIPDYRGKVYFLKGSTGWTEQKIDMLGVVPEKGAILQSDLTPEQIGEISEQANKKRIEGLTLTDREAEKNGIIDSLAGQAADMRSKLEIQGVSPAKALTDSKKWYETEVKKVEAKYSIK